MTTQQTQTFRLYRKITPTMARILTEFDYDARGGIIQTNEGPKSFLPGDSLARDGKGEWPIAASTIRVGYERLGPAATDGFVAYRSTKLHEACQMSEAFTVGTLSGKPGDYYLVREGDREWPIDREIFEASYELAEEEDTVRSR